ncbi:hypothetical protein [Amycolatopsis suaedae]|uniref:Uncharacterized protein n=1 Tax=Amycolatopsis suaedae TaxID=2510978 RepID=A0A4Q7JBZ6_9PSEU|nr:hypothetical protein [Amycolatopsis suaedae]RZQ64033.1 hypothetical protein EWH70_08495 [Amycolatopsis suaedae]
MADNEIRRFDGVSLVGGIVTLGVAGFVLSGGSWFGGLDLRWILAVGAVLVGVLMLVASVRGKRL